MNSKKISTLIKYSGLSILCLIVIWGFFMVGSPTKNRMIASDVNQIHDLQSIKRNLEYFYEKEKHLPDDLNQIIEEYSLPLDTIDSITKNNYYYKKIDLLNYELGATFQLDSSEATIHEESISRVNYKNKLIDDNWTHPKGYYVFKFTVLKK